MLDKNNLYKVLFVVSVAFIIVKVFIISVTEYNLQFYQFLNIVMLGIVSLWSYSKLSNKLIISDNLLGWSLIVFGLIYLFSDIFSLF
jgi:hypothetical protein